MLNNGNRYKCLDCGVRLYNNIRADKHTAKTNHKTAINKKATSAVEKYRASNILSYHSRLVIKDIMLESSGL